MSASPAKNINCYAVAFLFGYIHTFDMVKLIKVMWAMFGSLRVLRKRRPSSFGWKKKYLGIVCVYFQGNIVMVFLTLAHLKDSWHDAIWSGWNLTLGRSSAHTEPLHWTGLSFFSRVFVSSLRVSFSLGFQFSKIIYHHSFSAAAYSAPQKKQFIYIV